MSYKNEFIKQVKQDQKRFNFTHMHALVFFQKEVFSLIKIISFEDDHFVHEVKTEIQKGIFDKLLVHVQYNQIFGWSPITEKISNFIKNSETQISPVNIHNFKE